MYPEFGKAPIKCAKRGCNWRGYETSMDSRKEVSPGGLTINRSVCPSCGNNDYYFMTEKEIAAWEKQKPTTKKEQEHDK